MRKLKYYIIEDGKRTGSITTNDIDAWVKEHYSHKDDKGKVVVDKQKREIVFKFTLAESMQRSMRLRKERLAKENES